MAKTQKGLGKGLGALFSETPEFTESAQNAPNTLPIQKLEPNPEQPRTEFDPVALEELAGSIRAHGLLQPITVRPMEGGYYQIIAGERRWRACREAGLTEVPVTILNVDDRTAAQLALIENLQREDLSPAEEARGYDSLMKNFGLTQEGVADSVSKSRSSVANSLRLLKLPESVLKLVDSGSLSGGHARALIQLERESLQLEAAKTVVEKQLSVRQTETLVKQMVRELLRQGKEPEPEQISILDVDYVKACARDLTKLLGRKVTIRTGREKGSVQIEYYGEDDLEHLYEILTKMGKDQVEAGKIY